MTKEELKTLISGTHEGDLAAQKATMFKVIDELYDQIDTVTTLAEGKYSPGGTGTAAEIAALTTPVKNALYRVITTGGNLNSGGDQITVAVRDVVYHDGTKWVLFVDADA